MNIDAAAATQITDSTFANAVSTKVAKKAMDIAKAQGEAAVSLIRSAAETQVSVEPGRLDVTA